MKTAAVLFLFSAGIYAQPAPIELLKQEALKARKLADDGTKWAEMDRPVRAMHSRLHDWIDAELRGMETPEVGPLMGLEVSLNEQLDRAGLTLPDRDDVDIGYGFARVSIDWLPEAPGSIFVVASVAAGCGFDDAVYMYSFETGHWKEVFANHPEGFTSQRPRVSESDSLGRRLLLLTYSSVQCASTWMGMVFAVFRLDAGGNARELLSDRHGFWLGNDGPEFVLTPEELTIEFLDRSVDVGIHNRTEIQRYRFGEDGVRRLDPVAFQPQDFMEEWLTRPWSEMQERSAAGLAGVHEALQASDSGDYGVVAPCPGRPGRWVVSLETRYQGDKKLDRPIERYFVVADLGHYRYRMESVWSDAPEGCKVIPSPATAPSEKHPWLTADELRALSQTH